MGLTPSTTFHSSTYGTPRPVQDESGVLPYGVNRFIELTPRAVTMWKHLGKVWAFSRELKHLPHVSIDLMLAATEGNAPFFREVTEEFYRDAVGPHPKFPLVSRMRYGLAVCNLREIGHDYYGHLDSAGKRNIKKAQRLGYRFATFNFNDQLDAVTRIHRSSLVRQGRQIHERLLQQAIPNNNPPSRNPLHAYPYFGIFQGDTLVAYAACLIAGELCEIQTIYGHAHYHSDGVIPMLLNAISGHLAMHHPQAIYFTYGTFYGATPSMQRFKRKFLFEPSRVSWRLGR